MSLESSLLYEDSTITQSGQISKERSYDYLKPVRFHDRCRQYSKGHNGEDSAAVKSMILLLLSIRMKIVMYSLETRT